MAYDPNLDAFRNQTTGAFDHNGAINAGRQQATYGQTLSGQQPGESADLFAKRQEEYNRLTQQK